MMDKDQWWNVMRYLGFVLLVIAFILLIYAVAHK